MSFWNSEAQTVERWEPIAHNTYPTWVGIDCGCCAGISWGGDTVRECPDCFGLGRRWVHASSGTVAAWPGGPLLGTAGRSEVDTARRFLRRSVPPASGKER